MAYLGCHLYNENTEDIIKPATDVFEINDFTAASDWENFIDDIENILRNWRICEANTSIKVTDSFQCKTAILFFKELDRNDFLNCSWKTRKERLQFYGFPFLLIHYKLDTASCPGDELTGSSQLLTDLMSSAGDFCPRGPRPAIMFGVREVLVLGPAGEDTLGNDTRAKMVQGAVNIALSNTNCPLPCLIQVSKLAGKPRLTEQSAAGNGLQEGAVQR